MKQPSLPATSLLTTRAVALLVSLIASVPAAYSQAGLQTTWTWVKGPKEPYDGGNPGTMGVAAPGNVPMSRYSGSTFKDNSGNLWLFGGFNYLPAPMYFYFNDLWQFNPATGNWTWMKGSSAPNAAGSYGSIGVAAPANSPGARSDAASWVDSDGNFWLFGGTGLDASGQEGFLNDLWQFQVSTGNWVWMGGSHFRDAAGNYGQQGVASGSNMPSARTNMMFWRDNAGQLWVYGGYNHLSQRTNDLWRYSIATNTWTWMNGSTSGNAPIVYGAIGIPAATNTPGARAYGHAWTDAANNLYLFGGSHGSYSYNDLWKYTPQNNQWTWIHGDSLPLSPAVTGTQGVAHPQNRPGARVAGAGFTDLQRNFWLFGGWGIAPSSPIVGGLNDLWKYSPATNQWTWMKGAELNAYGIYGTQGSPSTGNNPGSRWSAMSWSAPANDLWIFGGLGYGETAGWGELNDLWRLNSNALTLSTSALSATPVPLTLYPNPARSQLRFELAAAAMGKLSCRIVDASGRTVLSGAPVRETADRYSIDVAHLLPGTYTVLIQTNAGTRQASFVKQ
ncbi:Kelch repeat-containing protein [Flaviaesturariibacter amylovorans]|uniref:Secretion system C-terminal sorting domain-containing protein n=1 Tax=Flaviaesturariibacter amylovorans TaxID=1084520 RepID=A0ABP8GKB3_9BACT